VQVQTVKLLLEEAVQEKEKVEAQVQKERSASLRFQQECQLLRRELAKAKDDLASETLVSHSSPLALLSVFVFV
jgi:molecular chaperone GrpE (heat shock protein)